MPQNLLEAPPAALAEELVEPLAAPPGTRVDRIVSHGHASPPGFWYDQEEDEWVAVLAGRARIRLEDPEEVVELLPGDHLLIPARRRHRVEWTLAGQATIWLAVFSRIGGGSDGPA